MSRASPDPEGTADPTSPSGPGHALLFVVYAVVAWIPCLIGGLLVGTALASRRGDDGVVQGGRLGMGGAWREILAAWLVFLVVAYVVPAVWLNRRRR